MVKYLLFGLLLIGNSLLAAPPRVITLAPHLTELAFAAGITPVAVSAWSDYPAQAASLEQVANWQGIKVERIIQLKPDVVLAWRGGNPQRQIDQLRQLGLNIVWIDPQSLEAMIDALASLQRWSPQPQKAAAAAQALRTQLAALRQHPRPRIPVPLFLQFGQQPLFTAARNTLQNEVIALCGGRNIFADSPVSWPQVSREQVLARHPHAIVTVGDAQKAANVADFWRPQLNVPVIAIDENEFSRPGPRMLLAAKQLCAQLHAQEK